ncbi:MAG: energy transducer TonB [Candidatus Sulfotelmatobacter sp.]
MSRIAIAVPLLLLALTQFSTHALAQQPSESGRKIVLRVIPQYPSLARSLNMQGNVKAEVIVAPNGTARSVDVKGGHPLFVQSAQNALRQWKWEPLAHETHESVELRFIP